MLLFYCRINNYTDLIDKLFLKQLRLLYECIPMAFIVSQAGGLASNGEVDILDITPSDIHQRSAIFLGSKEDVKDVLQHIKKHKNK